MSNFSLPLPCFGHDTDRKRPFSSVEEKGRFVFHRNNARQWGERGAAFSQRGQSAFSAKPSLSENREYCCPVNFKTAEKSGLSDLGSDAATTERPFSPEFGLASQSWIPPRLPPQLPQPPLHPPTRARYTRVRRFSLFAFTSSPQVRKKLCINDLQVKDSPLLPSPVKAKNDTILHPQNTLYQ